MKTPCKGCSKRHAECHATCEDYKEFSRENEKLKDKIRQTKIIDRVIREGSKRR